MPDAPDSAFWTWALKAYARPGVAAACLALQDRFGQCVPYLLWAAWRTETGPGLSAAQRIAGAELAGRWEATVTGPLRAARRGLKPPAPGVGDRAREALRQEVKAMELTSERILMQALEDLALASPPPPAIGASTLVQALGAAAAAWPVEAAPEALERLAQTLS